MKKLFRGIAILAAVAAVGTGVAFATGCDPVEEKKPETTAKTGEAYGLVHGAGYVGYASITVDGDKVTALTLTEVCFPSQVSIKGTSTETAEAAKAAIPYATGTTAADYVVVETSSTKDEVTTYTATAYYKTVSYGDVTMVYDAAAKSYKVGEKTLKEYFTTEANCKAYYEAAVSDKITVTVGTEKKTGVMNKKALSKEENGYWSGSNYPLGWKGNRDATVKYVKENGVANLLKLVKQQKGENDPKDTQYFWMDGTVSTGATWTDMNTTKEGSLSYAQLITNAYNAKK